MTSNTFFSKLQNIIYTLSSLAIIGTLLSGCMASTELQVLQPASFAIPDHIEKIATLNRSIPPKKFGNTVEAIFTGEGIYQDRNGADNAINGLTQALTRTPRFNVKQTGIVLEGSGNRRFPEPLSWAEIERICQTYGTDAVVALESYDTDTHENLSEHKNKKKDKEGNEIVEVSYCANLNTTVKLGWRMYDPKKRMIIDEFSVVEQLGWEGNGGTERDAVGDLPHKQLTVDQTSGAAGTKYGMRIAPTWVFTERSFYTKGSDGMKRAARLAKRNRWKDAAAIWQAEISRGDKKIAKRAAYNMALAAEANGKLSSAYKWAVDAHRQYGNRKAKNYARELNFRMSEQQRVNQQMGESKQISTSSNSSNSNKQRPPARVRPSR